MINVRDVCKRLGANQVLEDINFEVKKGTVFGLVGENGAGKTTLIKCMTGIYKPEKGHINIDKQDVFDNPKAKIKIGYVAEQNQYFQSYKIAEMLKFYELTYQDFSRKNFNNLNENFKLNINSRIRELSKGMQMRLALMLNLCHHPEVLILDEPTSGLDPVAKRNFIKILMQEVEERKTTVFISSHHLSDLERICDTIAVIKKGRIQYINSLEEMKSNIRKLQVIFQNSPPEDMRNWPEIMAVEKIGRVFYLITKEYTEELTNKLHNENPIFVEEVDLSLEDMFIYSAEEGLADA